MPKYASEITRALSRFILDQGELVSVYRPSDKSTHRYQAQGQPLSIDQAAKYDPQGADNIANSQPHLFAFGSLVDVRTGDKITFGGNTYRVVSAIANRIEGQAITLECVGVRE